MRPGREEAHVAHGDFTPAQIEAMGPVAVKYWDPQVGPAGEADQPLTTGQLELLDDVIREAERFTGLRFSAYLGDLGDNSGAFAQGLLSGLGADAPSSVLLAVSPGQRVVEVATGGELIKPRGVHGLRVGLATELQQPAIGRVDQRRASGLDHQAKTHGLR